MVQLTVAHLIKFPTHCQKIPAEFSVEVHDSSFKTPL